MVTVWCMSQTSRDRNNSRRVRTHEKNSRETVRRLGTIIQSIFCAQSGAGIRLNFWKYLGESQYPGALSSVLENFRRTLSPYTTDSPWVSEDDAIRTSLFYKSVHDNPSWKLLHLIGIGHWKSPQGGTRYSPR